MPDKIYFDGAADPNPGHSAFGFSHVSDGNEVAFQCGYLGITTNNVAEYRALLQALLYCQTNSIKNVEIYGDSQLVVNQVNGVYKTRNKCLKDLCEMCKKLISELNVSVHWVYREDNQRADYLSKLPLNEIKK